MDNKQNLIKEIIKQTNQYISYIQGNCSGDVTLSYQLGQKFANKHVTFERYSPQNESPIDQYIYLVECADGYSKMMPICKFELSIKNDECIKENISNIAHRFALVIYDYLIRQGIMSVGSEYNDPYGYIGKFGKYPSEEEMEIIKVQ